MSTAILPAKPRRALVLGSLTVLLHWGVLGWFNGQLGQVPPVRRTEVVTSYARLVRAEPRTVALAPLEPLPLPTLPLPPPLKVPPPPLPQAPEAAAEPGPVAALEPAPAAGQSGDQPGAGGQDGAAGAAGAGVKSVAEAAPAPAPPPAPVAAAAPAVPSYRVDLPPSADMTMDVDRVDADGTHWSGEAALGWRVDPGGYHIKVEVGIRLLFTRVNLLVLTSEGATGDDGFEPVRMTEKRRGRALTATHFNRQDAQITFSASPNKYQLFAGSQDKASVPLQLAGIARADPNQLSGNVDILVGEDRDASVFRFVLLGKEQIDTKVGKLSAWHLSRPPKPGSYSSRLDVWLSPERGWYPVKIRNTEASGAVTTQTVNNILMTGTGS